MQAPVIPGKIGQNLLSKVTAGHKIKIRLNRQRFMCPAVIIAKSQAVLDSITKMGVPDMLPGIGEMLGIINSRWEYFTTCN